MFELDDNGLDQLANIKVIGVGGGGSNAVNRMISLGLEGVEFIAVNTDAQALLTAMAPKRMQIGEKLTRGLGAGARPEIGEQAAQESREDILEALRGSDMVFITAGMGGGTGTGAAPIIAETAKEMGVLVVGVVTKPFGFEMRKRMATAEEGIAQLKKNVDALLIVENQKLLEMDNGLKIKIVDAYKKVDEVLRQAVQGVTDLITKEGFINLDFADIKTILKAPENGTATIAIMGMGEGEGEGRARKAAEQAINSPLMTLDLSGAKGMLLNVTTGPEITLGEMTEAADIIQTTADADAQVIWGHVIDESLGDKVHVTLIATFPEGAPQAAPGRRIITKPEPQKQPQPQLQQTGRQSQPQQPIRTGGRTLFDVYKQKRGAQENFVETSLTSPEDERSTFPDSLRRSYDQPALYRRTRN